MTKDEALRWALEALNDRASLIKWQWAREAVEQALGQPKQKDEKGRPVTYWGGLEQPKPEETVTITRKEYEAMLDSQRWVDCLEAAGVDNWEGYEIAIEYYQGVEE